MTRYVSTYSKFIASAAVLLLIGYPSLTFAVKGGMNGSFLLILILALAVLMVRPREMQPVVWDGEMKFYLWAMAALPIAVFLSQSYQHHYSGHPYDAVSRFMLAVPVFLLLRRVRMGVVSIVQYGFPLAAIIGFLMMKQNVVGRYATVTMDVIHFGDFELMLGMLSLASLHWTGRDEVLVRILKLTGFVAGCYASVMSGSRGGWLALPLFILLFVHFRFGRVSLKAVGAMLLTLCVAGGIAYMSSQSVEKRIDVMGYDLAGIEQGNLNTSIGVRLQLYQSALELFVQHPFFGVVPEGFAQEMDALQKAGKITVMAAELGKGEVHNELLAKAAGLGIFGLVAMLLVYLVPFRMFYRAMKSPLVQIRQSGMLGMVFVSGFMVFGLTVEVLNLTMAAAFYGLTVAVLLAACLNIHHGEQNSSAIAKVTHV